MMIRMAEIKDAAAVIHLYGGYDRPPDRKMDASEIEDHFKEINSRGFIAVAVVDDSIVGTYSIYFCANLAHAGRPFAVIENVIVAPHVHRHGIGRAKSVIEQRPALKCGLYYIFETSIKRIVDLH